MLQQQSNIFLIILSFLIGIILTIMPLPTFLIWARPQWVFAILLFWVITMPSQCGVILAWFSGILMDLVTGTPVGEHAIIFVLLIYILLKSHAVIVHSPRFQQASFIGVFALFNVLLHSMILGFAGHSTHIFLYGISVITTAFIWPWIFALLTRLQPRTMIC